MRTTPSIEKQLLEHLASIEKQIAELEAERKAIQRLITKDRKENIQRFDVTRRNSFSRIMVENKILETLNNNNYVSSKKLYISVKAVSFDLKESTFRSYLRRMKAKGLILPSHIRGSWRLAPIQNTTSIGV